MIRDQIIEIIRTHVQSAGSHHMVGREEAADALVKLFLHTWPKPFQSRVADWMMQCFGADITNSLMERCYRFSEEAGELVQSLGMTEQQWHDIGAYVWGRPVGETHQEIGGAMVTLAALCHAADDDMDKAGYDELARVSTPEMIDKIRRKHNDKKLRIPTSALPGDAESAGRTGLSGGID